jgi:hypothetical protein
MGMEAGMCSMLVLFNHTLSDEQVRQARELWNVIDFIHPPDDVSLGWSSIPPDIDGLRPLLSNVFAWLEDTASRGDILLVQGEFGAVFLVVRYAISMGVRAVYATTERRVREKRLSDGTVETVHEFRHVRFREYGK